MNKCPICNNEFFYETTECIPPMTMAYCSACNKHFEEIKTPDDNDLLIIEEESTEIDQKTWDKLKDFKCRNL